MTTDAGGPDDALDELDDRILRGIARAASHHDPVPEGLAERAVFAVAGAELEAELATLLASHAGEPVGVRGGDDTQARTLTFSGGHATVTVMLVATGRRQWRIDGWLTPDEDVHVRLRLTGEQRETAARDGRFSFEDVPQGMAQLQVVAADTGTVALVTPAIQL